MAIPMMGAIQGLAGIAGGMIGEKRSKEQLRLSLIEIKLDFLH
jgi:hypothetical protein